MALVHAESLDERPLPELGGVGPHACKDLLSWKGRRFMLPPSDPALLALHHGGPAAVPAHDNLVGAVRCWQEHPDWMDQLDPSSAVFEDKQMERALYLDEWQDHLPAGARVLDLGGGVGRFAQWLVGRGCEVELVDADLRSLWCAMDHLAGGPGGLDLHWSTGAKLGAMMPVDRAVAAELLCYVPDPHAVLDEVARVLKPDGLLLLSVESTAGAALHRDAVGGQLTEAGVIHLPGDCWVQTYTEHSLRDLLKGWKILSLQPSHYVLSGPLEEQAEGKSLDEIRSLERQARQDAQTTQMNRAWMAVVSPKG